MNEALAKNLIEGEQDNDEDPAILLEPKGNQPSATVSVPSPPSNDQNDVPNLDLIPDWLELDDSNLVDIMTEIEKYISQIVSQNSKPTQVMEIAGPSNTINFSSVNNVQKSPFIPGMYFPHSNVTINYNINSPK